MLNKIWNSVIPKLIALVIVLILLSNYYPPRGFVFTSEVDRPHGFAEYEREVQKRKLINENKLGHSLESYRFGPVGFAQMTFDTTFPTDFTNARKKFFMSLHNLYIKENSKLDGAKYFIENEKPYIIKGNLKEALPFYFKLNTDKSRGEQEITTTVMIPVSKTSKYILHGLWIVITVIGLFLFISIFLGGIIKLIQEIAKGKAFTKYTINILRNISYASLAVPLIYVLESIAVWLYMYLKYPGGFGLDPAVYSSFAKMIFVGVFFYALYRAFKKGYNLQQENDLTV